MFHNAPSPRHGVPQGSFSWLSSSTTLPKSCVVKFVPACWFWIRHYRASIVSHPVALSIHSRSRQGRSQWKGPDIKAFAIYAHWLKGSKPMYTPSAHGDSIQSGNLAFLESFPNIPVPNNLLQQKQLLHLLRLLLRRITPIILPLHLHNHLLHLPRLPRPLLRTHLCLLLEELIVRLPITAAQSIPQRRELPVVVVEV